MWRLRAIGRSLPVLLVIAYVTLGVTGDPRLTAALAGSIALPVIAYIAIMPRWRYRVHRWEVAEEAVYSRAGWFVQEWRIAPMSRIQTVDTVRGPLQQWLGISTVTVTTASAAGSIEIEALDREQAERLVQRLTEATEAVPGDAT